MIIWDKIQVKLRILFCTLFKKGKVENNISIFCNNCIGAFVAHDYNLQFNSPTVNLMIPPTEFIEYIAHLDEYNNEINIEEILGCKGYPEGLLNNVSSTNCKCL